MYKGREEDEVRENLLVFCPNNVYDLQTAFSIIHSPVWYLEYGRFWTTLHYSPFHIFPLILGNDEYSALLLTWEWTQIPLINFSSWTQWICFPYGLQIKGNIFNWLNNPLVLWIMRIHAFLFMLNRDGNLFQKVLKQSNVGNLGTILLARVISLSLFMFQ